jgi:uncharacterized protein (DUF58 family)
VPVARPLKVVAYGLLGLGALTVALLAGRPAVAALGGPLLLYVAVALARPAPALRGGPPVCSHTQAVEGDHVELTLPLAGLGGVDRLDVAIALPRGLSLEHPVLSVAAGVPLGVDVRCERWGAHRLGPVGIRGWDALGATAVDLELPASEVLRVYPRTESLRSLAAPLVTQALTGSRRSRVRGEGIEYADVRPYAPGDPLRQVNWRASGRGRGLYISERHPDRNADVVLVVDGFADAYATAPGPSDDAVRIAATLAAAYLRERDRVGVVGFGTGVWWLRGGLGLRQLHRIAGALIESQAATTYAWRGVATIDRRVLPAGALVIVVTPLTDRRSAEAVAQLHARGHDVAVIEIASAAYLGKPHDAAARAAREIWELGRSRERDALRSRGVPVVEWREGQRLERVVWELIGWRRAAQRRSA